MKMRIENLFSFKGRRLHLEHVRDIGRVNNVCEMIFSDPKTKENFRVSRDGLRYSERVVDSDICCFLDDLDIKSLKKDEMIYIFYAQRIQAASFIKIEEGTARVYVYGEKNSKYYRKISPCQIIARPHKFEPIEETNVSECECGAIKTERAHAS